MGLIPLLFAVRGASPRDALKLGYVAGLAFWLPIVSWLRYVTVFGWLLLAAYCALYVAPFALFCCLWLRQRDPAKWWNNLGFMVVGAAVWVTLEYARSIWFTGFPWNTLAISQFEFVPLIQIASWGGVYAVSALLLVLNLGIGTTLLRYLLAGARPGRTAHPEILLPLLVVALAMSWGMQVIRSPRPPSTPIHIGIVQPNIPQPFKWDASTVDLIFERLHRHTLEVQEEGDLDLIVWPETALPADVRNSEVCYDFVRSLTWGKTPLLVGSTDTAWTDDREPIFFNSSFLFDEKATLRAGYDKQHLVLFGEYLPFENLLPFLTALTPNQASFSAGTNAVVMTMDRPPVALSPLICFEDTLPYLGRRAVLAGARLLINQTNDAWFEQSSASRQHLAHGVFRSVENRVPTVRAANTGISGHIDEFGVIAATLADDTGNTFVEGSLKVWVLTPPEEMALTFYTRRGDLFAWGCVVLACFWGVGQGMRARRERRGT